MSKSLGDPPMSNATPAVITAALGLLVGYDTAISENSPTSSAVQNERSQELQSLADAIHSVVTDATALDKQFSSLVKRATKGDVRNIVPANDLGVLEELLTNLRGVEAGLKRASVPSELTDLHLKARRAIAQGRSRVATFHMLASQAYAIPVVLKSKVDPAGLKALAEHSTKRVIELANA